MQNRDINTSIKYKISYSQVKEFKDKDLIITIMPLAKQSLIVAKYIQLCAYYLL